LMAAAFADHGESIYQLVPPPAPVKQRPRKYVSQHDPKLPPTASTFVPSGTTAGTVSNVSGDATTKPVADLPGRTFGKPPGASAPDPSNRPQGKTAKVATLSEVKKSNPVLLQPSQLKAKLKPDVPKKADAPVMNLVSSKNFVVANAVEAILAVPRKGSDGDRDYLRKDDFGKTPKYLSRVKANIDDEKNYIANLMQQQEEAARARERPLDEAEREQLVNGLKEKWEGVNRQYQSMAHLTKLEGPQIRRKARMEAELVQIEKDIEKLSRKNIIIHTDY